MFGLLIKDVDFLWTEQCQTAFETLKAKLSMAPVLRGPNWALPFHISTDASDTAIGGVLGKKEDQQSYAIYFVSKNLSPAELNYTVTEKEFLAVVHAINKFHHYITGYKVFVHTDHSAIRFLMNKPITNGRVTRWLLLLQEFNITVLDRPGKENLVVDFLSRIKNEDDDIPVDDSFLDEHLFSLSVNTPWFADMENYLATRKLPSHLSPHEKRRIITQSANYSWVGHDLFHTGPDLIIRRCVKKMRYQKYYEVVSFKGSKDRNLFQLAQNSFLAIFAIFLFLAVFNFSGHFEGLNECFSGLSFLMISYVMIEAQK
jgi:hypothetical protein